MKNSNKVYIFTGANELFINAAERFVALANQAIDRRGIFSVSLSGGGTPLGLYRALAQSPWCDQIKWSRVIFFWGDERCVPPDHPESNYHAINQVLFKPLSIPAENIHRIKGELPPQEAAGEYLKTLSAFLSTYARHAQPQPIFDLVLLGLGEDGHFASVFPDSPETKKPVIAVTASYQGRPAHRVTLTPVIFNDARRILFLVTGAAKAPALAATLAGPSNPKRWPAQRIDPHNGRIAWLVDQPAAAALPDEFRLQQQEE